jgi:hypothetical protein
MKKLITKPHLFFFGLALLFVIIAIVKGKNSLEINISLAKFDIQVKTFCLISSLFFVLIGFNYFSIIWANRQPRKWLTIIHIVLQIVALAPFIYLLSTANNSSETNTDNDLKLLIATNFIGFLLFLLATLIHLVNFFSSLFLKKE